MRMVGMAADYVFLDRWTIPAPIDVAYRVVGDVQEYHRWWRGFVASDGDAWPPEPGKRSSVAVRSFLPYTVHLGLECLDAIAPYRIHSQLSGDFDGTGTWTLESQPDGTTLATLDWRPTVVMPLVRRLTPALRPLFRANHAAVMRWGQERVGEEAARVAAARVPTPVG